MNRKKLAFIGLTLLIVGAIGSFLTYKEVKADFVTEEETVSKDNITRLDIEANNEKVEILPTNDSNILVRYTGEKSNQNKDALSIEEDGTVLKIEVNDKQLFSFQFDFFTRPSSLKVYLPEKTYEELKVDLGNGAIEAQDLSIKDIDAKTNNGQIIFESIEADTIKVGTHNGRVNLEGVEGDLQARVNNGAISLDTADMDRSITFETDNGSIKIKTDKEPTDAILDAKTNNGRVSIFGNTNWDSVTGEGTHKIKLVTKNGSITVTR